MFKLYDVKLFTLIKSKKLNPVSVSYESIMFVLPI